MQSLTQIRELLAAHGLAPKKSLGQNFLIDHNLIRKLVDSAGVASGDVVLEVGPGTGTMTEELLARGAHVIACELDTGLAGLLRDRLADRVEQKDRDRLEDSTITGTFTLIEGDCLEGKHALNAEVKAVLAARPFKLVSNLPYGAGTPLLSTLITDHPECSAMAITVQREVADRIAARPGSKEYGALSIIAQAMCEVESVATLPPECFWPRPDVTSKMVKLTRRADPLTADPGGLGEACRVIFAQRRKQLGSILGRGFPWPAGIAPELRAEQLSLAAVIALAEAMKRATRPPSTGVSNERKPAERTE